MPSAASFSAYSVRVVLVRVDRLVHQRLGERRLVRFVVAVAAVADDVQHDVAAELHAVLGRHPGAEYHRLRVVAVDVQDRRLDRFRDVGAVQPGVGMRRDRGEADLVVDDQVDRPAGAVADQLAHRQRLIHQPLTGKRRVAVHQDRHDRPALLGIAGAVLPRANLADDHGIDGFQVRRVWLQRQMDVVPGDLDIGRCAEVVLHVAGALHVVGLEAFAAELAEQRGQRLLDDVDQGVQAAAVRHPDGDFHHAVCRGRLDHRVQRRDRDLPAFQAEALGGDVALLAERLEPFGFGQVLQDSALFVGIQESSCQGAPSTWRWIQDFCSGSWMCMNSTPIGPQ